ncbi:hypothetical protein N7541_003199 [Penicillium brevicompactum]|uniref:Uncharacterized protein n=1 Tax=Penicillium brevicompactum TaxID=5074 RepID=A0A9W9RMP3_PENBR|nr:hypothetical protein N7541_003199 [Penicillium brevicompactum]
MLQATLHGTHPELLGGCERILDRLKIIPGGNQVDISNSVTRIASSKQLTNYCSSAVPQNDRASNFAASGYQDIPDLALSKFSAMRKSPNLSGDTEGMMLPAGSNSRESCSNTERKNPTSETVDRSVGAQFTYTYSFLETSFARRLKRFSLEYAFQIFDDPHSDPHEVFRLFRLVPCFRERAKMYPYFKELVTSNRGHSLEISSLPFYTIGGAGTHYADIDDAGNPMYPPNSRVPRRILGILPMSTEGDPQNDISQTQQAQLELCGFGGDWFDCRDVEGYLKARGVQLDESTVCPSMRYVPSENGLGRESRNITFDLEYFTEIIVGYMVVVKFRRYERMASIEVPFLHGRRELSTMTTDEAHEIISQLQEFEFPYAFGKARKIALLKAGAIPTMSKLFAVTGQNNKRNSGKRAVDTEILLREAQSKARDSDRYQRAVARMNYLHARYRKADKITDDDLLHTLGDGLFEIVNVVNREEWRALSEVELCALGVFHKNLGEDMGIPFDKLASCKKGWKNGLHFANELQDWTLRYEQEVAKPTATNDQYVRVYVDSALSSLPAFVCIAVRQMLGASLDNVMRTSLCLEYPGPVYLTLLISIREARKIFLRHFSLPRAGALKLVSELPNSETGLYSFGRKTLQPWYMEPNFWSSWGPGAILVRALGGKVPGARGDRYHPQGYDLMTIGPSPQKEKGQAEMMSDIEVIKSRTMASCPFSHAKNGGFNTA